IDAALKVADAVGFLGPMALLKDPPRPGSPISEGERIDREVDSGFTGVSLLVKDDFHSARDGALQAARACRLELGLELVIANESPALAVELAAELRSRGVNPSCLRVSGHEAECRPLADQLGSFALSSEREALGPSLRTTGVQELVAAGPFLRSLKRTAPRDLWWKLTHWADERQASLDQSTAKHARALRELPAPSQDKLEALCCYEAAELFARTGAAGTGLRIASRIATYAEEHA
ncbi:MAG: hypothetical protein JST92_24815, partial [Deltaproteobacteria bacterium]|nr:hypothetical protein [Deltaproteobacteria bacterium]